MLPPATAFCIPPHLSAVPLGQGGQASVPGAWRERFRPDASLAEFHAEATAVALRRRAHRGLRDEVAPQTVNCASSGMSSISSFTSRTPGTSLANSFSATRISGDRAKPCSVTTPSRTSGNTQ